jgi:hypothetical protein
MCRNIQTLYNFEPEATEDDVHAAALQYVRKISGFNKPSKANEEAFHRAVHAVADASARLLSELVTSAPARSREASARLGGFGETSLAPPAAQPMLRRALLGEA